MSKKYLVKLNDEVKGPYSLLEIKDLVSDGFFPKYIKYSEVGANRWLGLDHLLNEGELADSDESIAINLEKIVDTSQVEDSRQVFVKKLRRKKDEIENEAVDESDLSETILSKKTDQFFEDQKLQSEQNLSKTLGELEKGKLSKNKTQFYDIEEFREALKEADETEKKLEEKRKLQESGLSKAAKDPVNRRIFFTILLALGALYLVVTPWDVGVDGSKNEGFIFPIITNPQQQKTNREQSDKLLTRVLEDDSEVYIDQLKKITLLKQSIKLYNNKDARAKLAGTYGKILRFSDQKLDAIKVITNQIKLSGKKDDYSSPDIIDAKMSLFYFLKKYDAVKYLYQKVERLNFENSHYALSIMIKSLINSGRIDQLGYYVEKAFQVKNPNYYILDSILDYLYFENNYEDYGRLASRSVEQIPNSYDLLLHLSRYYLLSRDLNKAKRVLRVIRDKSYGRHPIYKAQYYEQRGMIVSYEKKPEEAFKYFEASYKLIPSDNVIVRMAQIKKGQDLDEVSDNLDKTNAQFNLKKSKEFTREKKWSMALFSAINAVDAYPNYIPAKLQLAKVQIQRGYYDDATKVLSKIFDPAFLSAKNRLVLKSLVKSQKNKDVKEYIKKINPKVLDTDYKLNYIVADYFNQVGETLKAVLWYNRTLEIFTLHDESYWKLAEIYRADGNYIKAKQAIRKALEIDPSMTAYHIEYAKVLFAEHGLKTAAGYLRNLDKDDHPIDKVNNQVAVFYYQNGEIDSFKNLLEELKIDNQTSKDLYYFLMNSAAREEDYDSVIKYGTKYLQLNPSDHEVRIFMGQHFYYQQNYEEAGRHFDLVHKSVSTYPQINAELSKLALIEGDFDQAQKYADLEIEHNKNRYYGYLQSAKISIKKKDFVQAESFLKKAMRVDQENTIVLSELGYVLLKRNKLDDALQVFEKALKVDEDHYYLYYRIGEVYKLKGDFKKAAEYFNIYLDLNPRATEKKEIESFLSQVSELNK